MFTGIIAEIGRVKRLTPVADGLRLEVSGPAVAAGANLGDSISVNGVCLTVAELSTDGFAADVMGVTAAVTNLGGLVAGQSVNLESALTANGKLGGHFVQGHIDGVGTVLARTKQPNWLTLRISLPADLAALVAAKGSIAVEGVSLTVAAVGSDWFEVGLIPTTWRETTLGDLEVGAVVNLETDLLARQIARYLQAANG